MATTETKSKTNPLLPRLKDNHNVGNLDDAGKWYDRQPDELDKISKGLNVDVAQVQINSIPDIWARALLFEMALLDEDHKLHKKIRDEWRGLLTLLALKEVKNHTNLKAIGINLSSEIETNNKVWHKALVELIPDDSLFDGTTWNYLYIFLAGDRAIGMTSPNTIVFTATDYYNLTFSEKWYDGKTLEDPVSHLSDEERNILAGWIDNLITNLQKHPVSDSTRHGKLVEKLQEFKNDIRATAPKFNEGLTSFEIKGSEAGIFVYLNKPAAAPTGDPASSNVRLKTSDGRNPSKPILLVDEDIAGSWHIQPQNVTVHGALTLASIPAGGLLPNQHSKFGNIDIDTAEIWIPTELLTDKLFYINFPKAFPGAMSETWIGNQPQINKQPISIILPIRKNLLEHLTPNDLMKGVNFNQDSNGDITIRLRVKLSGFDEAGKDYEIVKKYERNQIEAYSQVPILEIFPNFISNESISEEKRWKVYYAAYSADDKSATFQIEPYPEYVEEVSIPILKNQNGKRSIWRLNKFPEAMVCSAEGEEAGILLLQKPELAPAPSRPFTVGVDFGASGTSVYYLDGNTKLQLNFNNRKLAVTEMSLAQKADVGKFFLPEDNSQTPFLTLFHDFNNTNDQSNMIPLLNGHIYYYARKKTTEKDKQATDSNKKSELTENKIYADLKWSEKSDVRRAVRSFLSQICLQSSAELAIKGASSIDWKYSYPTAFSDEQLIDFNSIWSQIIKESYEITGIAADSVSNLTESVASAQYFLDAQDASTATGVVFIDIGSSTSDISVWQNNELAWQVSLRYAGRDIFLNYLKQHLNVLQTFNLLNKEIDDASKISEIANTIFYAEVDSVLQSQTDDIFGNLPIHAAKSEIRNLKQHLALGLSGLFFYIGLGISGLGKSYNAKTPHIYVGGNGSQMFRWLTNGASITRDHPFAKLFEKIFLSAVDFDLDGVFDLSMSSQPKKEAAYGLVCDSILKRPVDDKNIVFAGENFVLDGKIHKWRETLDKDTIKTGVAPPKEFEKLNQFIKTFNEFAESSELIQKVDYNAKMADGVYRLLDNSLKSQKFVEPVFILAIKHLLEINAKK